MRPGLLATFLIAALTVGAAGCAGSTGSASSGGAGTSQLPVARVAAARIAIGGDYAGSITDGALKGRFVAQLAPSADMYGGSLVATFGAKTLHGVVVLSGAPATLHGTLIMPLTNPCSYAVSLRFKPTAATLHGTYTASQGCTGSSGTLSAKEQCYYKPAAASTSIDRPNTLSVRAC